MKFFYFFILMVSLISCSRKPKVTPAPVSNIPAPVSNIKEENSNDKTNKIEDTPEVKAAKAATLNAKEQMEAAMAKAMSAKK